MESPTIHYIPLLIHRGSGNEFFDEQKKGKLCDVYQQCEIEQNYIRPEMLGSTTSVKNQILDQIRHDRS